MSLTVTAPTWTSDPSVLLAAFALIGGALGWAVNRVVGFVTAPRTR
jgi:hypothetical protein